MVNYGLFGPLLKVHLLRKSLKANRSKRHSIGSVLAAKLGLKSAGETGMPEHRIRPHDFSEAVKIVVDKQPGTGKDPLVASHMGRLGDV